MSSIVTVQKGHGTFAIKVKYKNPQTGDVIIEDVFKDMEIRSYVVFDTQSIEIEEIQSIDSY